ncbi:MAG: hypothetical protein JOZ29_06520 [Deltaproteobacteria bacterium]|nr:hypothetical protein [Deltaproteobacteria bacterium]
MDFSEVIDGLIDRPAVERSGSAFMWERLSAAAGDVNRISSEDEDEDKDSGISQHHQVAWLRMICKYGAHPGRIGRGWQEPTDLTGK